jgi:hypothetical protein
MTAKLADVAGTTGYEVHKAVEKRGEAVFRFVETVW